LEDISEVSVAGFGGGAWVKVNGRKQGARTLLEESMELSDSGAIKFDSFCQTSPFRIYNEYSLLESFGSSTL
jgi:hypothetical protein